MSALTATARPDQTPAGPLSPPSPLVRAVVVRAPGTAESAVDDLLHALAEQTHAPDDVIVLTTEATLGAEDLRRTLTRALGGRSTADEPEGLLLWLLPVGTLPTSEALAELLAVWRRSPSVGLVGPKHVDDAHPDRLLALDIQVTRSGRVLPDPAPGSPDQGQVDDRADVLAVPLAGSLVEAAVLRRLEGWQEGLGDLGADLDLGWRTQLAGRRVTVAPRAVHLSSAAAVTSAADNGARRRAARRVALARCSWWAWPGRALGSALTVLLGSLVLLIAKRPRAAWSEAAQLPATVSLRPWLTRWRTRGTRAVRRRDLARLFVPTSAVLARVGDELHDAVVPARPPGERSPRSDRSLVASVATHPALLAVLAATATVLVAARTLGVGALSAVNTGLTGGELRADPGDAAGLWQAWLDGWHGAGLGGTGTPAPHLPLLAALTWLVEHVPGYDPVAPAGATAALLLFGALPAAAASAYLASRVLTRRSGPRGLAALVWAVNPVTLAALAEGRLGAVLAAVLLPLAAAGLVLLTRASGSATSACATALAATLLLCVAPSLGLAVLVAAALLVVLARGARLRAATVLIAPVVLLAPWWPAVLSQPRLLLAGPGLTQWGGPAPTPWRTALLDVGGPLPWWAAIPVLVLAAVALVGVRRSPVAAWVGALLLLVGIAGALLAPLVPLGVVPDGATGTGGQVRSWVGTPLLLALLGVVVLVLLLAREQPRSEAVSPARRAAAATSLLLVAVAPVLAVVLGLGTALSAWADPRPAAAVDHARSGLASRALVVTTTSVGTTYAFLSRETSGPVRSTPSSVPADAAAAHDVAALLDPTEPDPGPLAARLGLDLIALTRGPANDLTRHLDTASGLARLADRDGYAVWRVLGSAAGSADLLAPPRLAVVEGDRVLAVPATASHGATRVTLAVAPGSRLVAAEPAAWADTAVVRAGGTVLTAQVVDGRPTYSVPSGRVPLTVSLDAPDRWLRWAVVLLFAGLVLLAIPFGRRETRGRR